MVVVVVVAVIYVGILSAIKLCYPWYRIVSCEICIIFECAMLAMYCNSESIL